jgi:hypothetical protein
MLMETSSASACTMSKDGNIRLQIRAAKLYWAIEQDLRGYIE